MTAAFDAWVEEARAVPIEEVARARVPSLKRTGRELVGPCPACGGRDRFAVSLRKRVFHCRGSGRAGDAIALVQYLDGCEFLAACESLVGRPPPGRDQAESPAERQARERELAERAERRRDEEARRQRAEFDYREAERKRCWRIWTKAERGLIGTPVEAYLKLRAIAAPAVAHLRYAPAHPLYGEAIEGRAGKELPVLHRGPAMLAAIIGPDNRFAGVHATWIDLGQSDGKLRLVDPATGELTPARKARGSTRGGRIELVRHPEPTRLFLGEGRETVLAVWCELRETAPDTVAGAAFWSAIDLGNLGGRATEMLAHPTATVVDRRGVTRPVMVPGPYPHPDWPALPIPESVRHLYLLGDGDSDPFATRCALIRAGLRYRSADRESYLLMAPEGADWNDVRRWGKAPP